MIFCRMLTAAVLMPPSGPFIAVVEQEVTLMIFASIAWAYVSSQFELTNYSNPNYSVSSQLGLPWPVPREPYERQYQSCCIRRRHPRWKVSRGHTIRHPIYLPLCREHFFLVPQSEIRPRSIFGSDSLGLHMLRRVHVHCCTLPICVLQHRQGGSGTTSSS